MNNFNKIMFIKEACTFSLPPPLPSYPPLLHFIFFLSSSKFKFQAHHHPFPILSVSLLSCYSLFLLRWSQHWFLNDKIQVRTYKLDVQIKEVRINGKVWTNKFQRSQSRRSQSTTRSKPTNRRYESKTSKIPSKKHRNRWWA